MVILSSNENFQYCCWGFRSNGNLPLYLIHWTFLFETLWYGDTLTSVHWLIMFPRSCVVSNLFLTDLISVRILILCLKTIVDLTTKSLVELGTSMVGTYQLNPSAAVIKTIRGTMRSMIKCCFHYFKSTFFHVYEK